MDNGNLNHEHTLGGLSIITTAEAIQSAMAIVSAAMRKHKIKEMAGVSTRKKEQFITEVKRSLATLGIHDIVVEWREEQDG